MKVFLSSENEEKLKTPIGEQKMFGFRRMKVLETLSGLANTAYPPVFQAFLTQKVYSTCLEIFFEYPWNNFVHATVEQMLTPLTTSFPDFLQMVKDLSLVDKIVKVSAENQKEEESSNPLFFRKGYMGYLFNISRLVENVASSSEGLKTYLEGNESWKVYVEGTYKDTVNRQKRPFMPSLPQNPFEDHNPQDFQEVEQNYNGYQDDFTDFLYQEEGDLNFGDRQYDYQNEQVNNFEDEDSEEDSGDEDTDEEDEEGPFSDEEQNTKSECWFWRRKR